MSLLPVFLKLAGRRCLVVGAGQVALDKIGSLLETGLSLRVVSPHALPEIQQLHRDGRLEWVQRCFEVSDLAGNVLVIAATDSPAVNAAVYRGSLERNVLCNSVDDIPNCDFYFGSVISRGDLQVAISTGGQSPAFSQRLRRELEDQLPDDLGPWLKNLGQLRREVLATQPRGEARKRLLHQLAKRPICTSEHCPSRQMALTSQAKSKHGDGNAAVRLNSTFRANAADHPANSEPSWSSMAETQESNAGTFPAEATVYLVGAGPGDPELLTVKAMRLIQSAEVILHDDLIPLAILELASPAAEIVNVGKRCGVRHVTQEEINALMVHHALESRSVVRLKSGDPLLFGRAAEEMAALTKAGVSYQIVSGITAAFAAAAAVGCSLTDRNGASSLIITTGHHAKSTQTSRLPQPEDATQILYMPGQNLQLRAEMWLRQGLPPNLPCALVSHAAQPNQQIQFTTLAKLGSAEPAVAPSLLLAGWAVRRVGDDSPSRSAPCDAERPDSSVNTGIAPKGCWQQLRLHRQ
jgi:uroporphyrin-III C-methyltransferase